MNSNNFGLTDRDYAVLLLEDADLEAQLLAVRSVLRRNAQADSELAREIEDLGKRAGEASGEYGMHLENTWVDHLHDSVFQDAAHSMAAVGMLAPMLESLFVATFRGIGDLKPPVTPVTLGGVRAAHVGDPKFWDPHFYFGVSRRQRIGIVRGIRQLAESTGLAPRLPADYGDVLNALFSYRNKMFHWGFEWPKDEREKFERLIVSEGWPSDWFTRSLSGGQTWILYMSDVLIRLVLTRIDEMLDGIGVFIQARYP
jgi:hypothetical protein